MGVRFKDTEKASVPYNTPFQTYEFFINKGLTPAQAAGVVGNLSIESAHFDPNVITGKRRGDSGKAVGLAQWHPDRWIPVSNYLKDKGMNPYTLEGQLEGIWHELQTTEKRAYNSLITANTPQEAANIFNKQYERSADKSNNRANYATKYYNEYVGAPAQSTVVVNTPEGEQSNTYAPVDLPHIPQGLTNLELLSEFTKLVESAKPKEIDPKIAKLQQKANETRFLSELVKNNELQYFKRTK